MAKPTKRASLERKMIKAFRARDAKKLQKLYQQHDKLTQPRKRKRNG